MLFLINVLLNAGVLSSAMWYGSTVSKSSKLYKIILILILVAFLNAMNGLFNSIQYQVQQSRAEFLDKYPRYVTEYVVNEDGEKVLRTRLMESK